MINIPRLSATKLDDQIKELKVALISVVKQANLEISMLNKKIEEVNKNGK